MPRYRYRAVSAAGEVVEGELDAGTQSGAVEQLHARGFLPIRAEEVGGGAGGLLGREVFGRRLPSRRDVALLTRELATLLNAGLPLDRALDILIELSDKAAVRRLLSHLLDDVRGGAALAAAMADHAEVFPAYYVSMVQAGEAGGALDEVLTRVADYMERAQLVRDRVLSALIYPAIVLCMAVLSIVVLVTVVVPEFRPFFEDAGQSLPWATQVVVDIADALAAYWWAGLIVLVLVALVVRAQLSQPASRRRWDRALLRLVLVGNIVTRIEVARFARIVGTLVANGVTLLNALAIARNVLGNSALAHEIDGVTEQLKQGRGLAEPLSRMELFPSLAVHLVRVGEETGRLEAMLVKLADIYEVEVERATQRFLAVLVPAVTIVLGVLIAGIIGSVISALFSVYDIPL